MAACPDVATRNLGCVFQDFRLLPNKSVAENVAFALEVIGKPRNIVKTQVSQVLDLVGLGQKANRMPDELSGGEQQRVAIARAFVNRPLVLLADEPTGNLDPNTSNGIMALLERINKIGTTIVMATHDVGIVDSMRRRVIELEHGHLVRRPGGGSVYGGRRRGPMPTSTLPGGPLAISIVAPNEGGIDVLGAAHRPCRVGGVRGGETASSWALSVECAAGKEASAANLWRNRFDGARAAGALPSARCRPPSSGLRFLRQAVNRQVDVLSGNVSLQIFMNADGDRSAQTERVREPADPPDAARQISHCTYLDHEASYKNRP